MLKDMNEIVKFTLERHSVKAKWRIIPLTYDKWKKFSKEKTSIDELALKLQNQLKKLMDNERVKFLLEEDEELKRRINESFEMEKEIQKEYGRVLTLEENLNSSAIILELKSIKHLKRWRIKLHLHYKLLEENKDTDFLILLNTRLICGDSRIEKLKTIVHETLHFIHNLKKTRTDFESIENEADRILYDFLFSKLT